MRRTRHLRRGISTYATPLFFSVVGDAAPLESRSVLFVALASLRGKKDWVIMLPCGVLKIAVARLQLRSILILKKSSGVSVPTFLAFTAAAALSRAQ